MSGAGNVFLMTDLRSPESQKLWSQFPASTMDRSQLSGLLCQSPLGFNADGLLFVEPCEGSEDFQWDFYNADGSQAEMCGNAARCVARFVHDLGDVGPSMNIRTIAGPVGARIIDDSEVEVQMPPISGTKWDQYVTIDDLKTHYHFVNSGVPHAVVGNDNVILTEEVRFFASRLRNHEDLQPDGANVTFFKPVAAGEIQAVTYERGVENFTQACGTGAVAAAWCHHQRQQGPATVKVGMPGGLLTVNFSGDRPLLAGPAVYLGEIKIHSEFFG